MNKIKHTKISHVLDNMTYQCNRVTWGANLAFQDIENWQARPHTVSFEATMMRTRRNLVLPTSAMWQINSKVTLTDSLRSTSKLPLYDKLTQLEAIHYLREFQTEPTRISLFNEAYLGEKTEINDIPAPLDSRFFTKSTRDPFLKNAVELRKNEKSYAPHIMMSEQVFMCVENENLEERSCDGEDIEEDFDSTDPIIYDPMNKMDWRQIIKGLPSELISQIENNLKNVSSPVQIIALYRREADTYMLKPTAKTRKPQIIYDGKGSYEINLVDGYGLGITEVAKTKSPILAHRLVENFDHGMFRHYLDNVKARAAVKNTYNFHYNKAVPYLNSLEQSTKIYSLN